MQVTVKLFASLRERLGYTEKSLDVSADWTVGDIWNLIVDGADVPAEVLMAINYSYVKPGAKVGEGDEIAFFPPVTGG